MFRVLKNKFKKEIYKEDMFAVVKNGVITTLVFSPFLAMLNYIVYLMLGFTSSLFVYLIGFFIARQIKSSHYSTHIIYQLISILYLIIGLFIYNIFSVFLMNLDFSLIAECIKVGLLETINIFNIFNYINNFSLNLIFNLLVIIYTFFHTFKNSKCNYN